MPLSFITNIAMETEQKNAMAGDITALLSKITGKEKPLVIVHFQCDANIVMGDDGGPVGLVEIQSPTFEKAHLDTLLDELVGIITKHTQIAPDRIAVQSTQCRPLYWGAHGKTTAYWED